jgi:hypothetical protein
MGSIMQEDVRAMQRRETATLEFVKRCPVNCWMNCTVNPAMRKRPWIPAWWVVRARVFGASKRSEVPDPTPHRSLPLTPV